MMVIEDSNRLSQSEWTFEHIVFSCVYSSEYDKQAKYTKKEQNLRLNLSLNKRFEMIPNSLDIANMKSISMHSLKFANATNVATLL